MKMKKILNICLAAAVVCAAEGVSARTVSLSAPAEAPQPAAREAAAPMPADNTRMAKPGKKTKAQTPAAYAATNRPAEAERLFRSEAVEQEIARIKGVLTNAKLAWMFENCFPNTLDTTVRARKDGSATYKVAAPQHYAAADMDVEGDYSQAAFLAVLGSTVGGITITGLPSGSHQGDRVILDILKQCGAKFERSGSHVTFHRSLLKAVEIDLADCPDLGPVLIALGCFCSGTTIIRNAGRLRIKECDRIAAMQEELAKMGGTVKADGDTLTIEGCALHKPTAPLNGHNDHRIVMAMAVAALAAGQPAVIEGANAVNKSWPDFFEVIKGLGAHVTNQG